MHSEQIRDWYERYKNGIFRYALSLLKDIGLAEDVLQEVFLKILSGKYAVYPGKEQAWLYKVTRNLCYDILRKQNWETEILTELPGQDCYVYLEMIASLDKIEQELVTLKIVGGLTHKEIAKVMGFTVHAAKKRYERAIQKLREEEV